MPLIKKRTTLLARHHKHMLFGYWLSRHINESITKDEFVKLLQVGSSLPEKIDFYSKFDQDSPELKGILKTMAKDAPVKQRSKRVKKNHLELSGNSVGFTEQLSGNSACSTEQLNVNNVGFTEHWSDSSPSYAENWSECSSPCYAEYFSENSVSIPEQLSVIKEEKKE